MNLLSHRRLILWVGLLVGLLFGLQLACNMPSFSSATATPVALTLVASWPTSPGPTAASPGSANAEQTKPIPPTSTPLPPTAGPTPSLTPTPQALYTGFIAYDQKQETITGYDFSGAAKNIKIKISGAEYLSLNEAQWANDSIYYVHKKNKAVYQIANNGAAQKIDFIPSKNDLHFLVSPDGKKIVWSFDTITGTAPSAELWLANIDGSNLKKIAQVDAATNSKWLVVQPYRWLADGRLLYMDAPTGIGGYILFYGFAGLHAYDPTSGKTTNLTPTVGAGGVCLREISPDLKTVLSTCAASSQSILSYVRLADNQALGIVRQNDQNQAGSPAYSPSGAWLAYAYARGEVGNETGKIALVASGATSPKVIDTVAKGYFNVFGWISENQFLVERFEDSLSATSIWLYSREPGPGVKLAAGKLVGFIK